MRTRIGLFAAILASTHSQHWQAQYSDRPLHRRRHASGSVAPWTSWKKVPIPPLPAFHPKQPTKIVLKNGMTIFLQEDHELPFINGFIMIRGGSRDEPADKTGLTDLYGETWRTSGTAAMTGDKMDDILEAKAAKIETNNDTRIHQPDLVQFQAGLRPSIWNGDGPAVASRISRGQTSARQAAGRHRNHSPQRRSRTDCGARSGIACLRQEQPLCTRAGIRHGACGDTGGPFCLASSHGGAKQHDSGN